MRREHRVGGDHPAWTVRCLSAIFSAVVLVPSVVNACGGQVRDEDVHAGGSAGASGDASGGSRGWSGGSAGKHSSDAAAGGSSATAGTGSFDASGGSNAGGVHGDGGTAGAIDGDDDVDGADASAVPCPPPADPSGGAPGTCNVASCPSEGGVACCVTPGGPCGTVREDGACASAGAVQCGGRWCSSFGETAAACCAGDACGFELGTNPCVYRTGYPAGCVATGQIGECDPTCPGAPTTHGWAFWCNKFSLPPTIQTMPGCRRPDGTCGAYYDLGIGCALPDSSDAGTDASDATDGVASDAEEASHAADTADAADAADPGDGAPP